MDADGNNGARTPGSSTTFTVIIPTSGRATLRHAFDSVAPQLEPGDEVIVVRDATGDWGDSARNSAIDRARGTYLLFMDDDDEFLPEALSVMRAFADENPGRIGIFRQRWELYDDVWRDPDVNQTASPMYCVPNLPGLVGRFRGPADAPRRGDVAFIRETVALQGEPVWREEFTNVVRPEKNPLRRLRYRLALRTRAKRLVRR